MSTTDQRRIEIALMVGRHDGRPILDQILPAIHRKAETKVGNNAAYCMPDPVNKFHQ